MHYRQLGKTHVKASILGFGCMRLPLINGLQNQIDLDKSDALFQRAYDLGVNYFDTAYFYHGENSESALGQGLKSFREKVNIATKLPPNRSQSQEDMELFLDTQLKRLQTDYIDFYLLHALNKNSWRQLQELKVAEFLQGALADGRIRHAAFSFHDDLDAFKEICDAFPWAFAQVQHNFLQTDFQAGSEGIAYAAERGLGIVIMEPLHGGDLAQVNPATQPVWDSFPQRRSPVAWALRYLWGQPSINVVLSGMSNMEQLQENAALASDPSFCAPLTAQEKKILADARLAMLAQTRVACTRCSYCMPCPHGVDIPGCFEHFNRSSIFNNHRLAKSRYGNLVRKEKDASRCRQCDHCLSLCPQQLPIPTLLKQVAKEFA
jgi:predicted aldo/keto reductase-like oxidoreductase